MISGDRSVNTAFETRDSQFAHCADRFIPRARVLNKGHARVEDISRERVLRVVRFSHCCARAGRIGGFMDARLRRRLEMAVRVRDFLRAHKTDGVAEGAALTRLEELVLRAEVLAAQQRAGIVATRAATEMRAEVRRALRSKLLLYRYAVGGVVAG